EYLGGRRAFFGVSVDLSTVPDFQRRVLEAARQIPFGEARPYAWVAAQIGRPRAVRAVGTALARNPVPLIVPCHRVWRSDGGLGPVRQAGPGGGAPAGCYSRVAHARQARRARLGADLGCARPGGLCHHPSAADGGGVRLADRALPG